MWKIINNKRETISKETYATKEEAEKIVELLIGISIGGYDFDVADLPKEMTWQEWIEWNEWE